MLSWSVRLSNLNIVWLSCLPCLLLGSLTCQIPVSTWWAAAAAAAAHTWALLLGKLGNLWLQPVHSSVRSYRQGGPYLLLILNNAYSFRSLAGSSINKIVPLSLPVFHRQAFFPRGRNPVDKLYSRSTPFSPPRLSHRNKLHVQPAT